MIRLARRTLFGATAAAALVPATPKAAAAITGPTVLFREGEAGYESYRIPALLRTLDGTLLAFCEMRHKFGDSGDINIGLRRSTDGGQTWTTAQIVTSLATDTAGNPCVMQDPSSGDIVLLCCRNRGQDDYSDIAGGTGRARRVYVQRSANGGQTWTSPDEITAQVHRPNWRWYATGPGVGAVLTAGPHAGRLVAGCNHTLAHTPPAGRAYDPKYAGQHLIYSDDGGRTWKIGPLSSNPDGEVNEDETAVTVLPDGRTVYANCRAAPSGIAPGNRADTYALDGAAYRLPMRPQACLTVPSCEGALLTLPDGRLLFSGPNGAERAALTLWTSDDSGRTWWLAYRVSGLPAAYSSMCLIGGDIGLLYETGDFSAYDRIEFRRIAIAALKGG
jgi:sialidase-1